MARNPQSTAIFEWLEEKTQSYFLAVSFGSYARGTAYSSSDVDVLLIDDQFSGWTVYEGQEATQILDWSSDFPELHLVCCSKREFEKRYCQSEEMVETIVEEGFAVNEDFGLVDYEKTIDCDEF